MSTGVAVSCFLDARFLTDDSESLSCGLRKALHNRPKKAM